MPTVIKKLDAGSYQLKDQVVSINRVTKVVKGGKNLSFAALVVVGDPSATTQYLITARYIESLRDMTRTQNSKVIFMPMETSSMLSSIGAMKEVFAETGEKQEKTEQVTGGQRNPRELNR